MSKAIPSKTLTTERKENEENMFSKFRHWIYFVAYVMLGLLVAIIVLLVTLVVMKQVDPGSDYASPIADALVLVVPNTTDVPVASITTAEPVTPSTTAEPVPPSTTAKPVTPGTTTTVPVILDLKRVSRPKSVTTITKKVTERWLPKGRGKSICTYVILKWNDECSSDHDCLSAHRYKYPYCVHSEGPRSRKICCRFV